MIFCYNLSLELKVKTGGPTVPVIVTTVAIRCAWHAIAIGITSILSIVIALSHHTVIVITVTLIVICVVIAAIITIVVGVILSDIIPTVHGEYCR